MPLPEAGRDPRGHHPYHGSDELLRPLPAPRHRAPRPATDILAELSKAPPPMPAVEAKPAVQEMDEAERDAILDSLITEILDNPQSAYRPDSELFQDFLVRCRIRRVRGQR